VFNGVQERELFFNVTEMAFGLKNEKNSPPRVNVLKAALVLYWLSCDEQLLPDHFPGRALWMQDL